MTAATLDPQQAEAARREGSRRVLFAAPIALLFGGIAASAAYGVARALGVPFPAGMGIAIVFVQSVFPAFGGAVLLALLTRTRAPVPAFLALVAAFVLAVLWSLLSGGADAAAGLDSARSTRVAVAAMHVARAVAIAAVLVRGLRATPARSGRTAGAR